MKKLFIFFSLISILFCAAPSFAAIKLASSLDITKTFFNPQTGRYVNALSLQDIHFHPNDTIIFHITIANRDTNTISEVNIKDTLPQYLTFVSGSGSFDSAKKTITITTNNLKPNTTQTFTIITKVIDLSSWPSNQDIICTANSATATGANQSQTGTAVAPFCIEKVFPPQRQTTTTPPTGAETNILMALLGSGIFGLLLRKKAHA